jgi:hypothetical protein
MKNTLQRPTLLLSSVLLSALAVGCGGNARTPEQWTEDTYKLLETKSPDVQSCYNEELKKNPLLEGKVTVDFIIHNRTGQFGKVRVDANKSTAADPVRKCVLKAVEDLKLGPPDANTGKATFTWEFKREIVKEPAPAPAGDKPAT